MKSLLTISEPPYEKTSLNFEELRQEAISYLEKTVGTLWNDYNVHDPGITILEALCFGITDIAHRVSFPDADLFAQKDQDTEKPFSSQPPFITARNALTCAPVTMNDYRKLILDYRKEEITESNGKIQSFVYPQEIENVWFRKTTQTLYGSRKVNSLYVSPDDADPGITAAPFTVSGLYDIKLLLRPSVSKEREEEIKHEISSLFHENRQLCTDLNNIDYVERHEVRICADIKLHADANVEQVYAEIIYKVQNYLNPTLKRYSLAEMVAKGFTTDEIFDGPPLKHGFILTEDLKKTSREETLTSPFKIYSSDLIVEILEITGVLAVPKLILNHYDTDLNAPDEWELEIPAGKQPVFELGEEDYYSIDFYKDILPFRPDMEEVKILRDKIEEESLNDQFVMPSEDFPIPAGQGVNLDLGAYTTLQEVFPPVYGVGSRGTNRDRDPSALGKAKQLKAFLLIFDQILSNYLGQLVNLTSLFSSNADLSQSFFANKVSDIPDLKDLLLKSAGKTNLSDLEVQEIYLDIIEASNSSLDIEIKQRANLQNHILARFGESFADYVLTHYTPTQKRTDLELTSYKATFLKEISQISSRRFVGHNYTDTEEVWNTTNVSGLKHRLERLLGFYSYKRRNLTNLLPDYYEEMDEDDKSEKRFRIEDYSQEPPKILLSGTAKYVDKIEAAKELHQAIKLGFSEANYDIKPTVDGRWYIVIINRNKEPEDIVAMRKHYYDTKEEAIAVRNELIGKIKDQFAEEGMYVLEHLLMRPRGPFASDNWPLLSPPKVEDDFSSLDPYSNQVHIILPGWGVRLEEIPFRAYIQKIIQRELPSHLIARICFIGKEHMADFEVCYRNYLTALAAYSNPPEMPTEEEAKSFYKAYADALAALVQCLKTLYTVYPVGTLHDCSSEDEETVRVILGKTHLGTN